MRSTGRSSLDAPLRFARSLTYFIRSLVAISGSSGVGKSSLCRAGVIPAVEDGALAMVVTGGAFGWFRANTRCWRWQSGLAPYLEQSTADVHSLSEREPAELVNASAEAGIIGKFGLATPWAPSVCGSI